MTNRRTGTESPSDNSVVIPVVMAFDPKYYFPACVTVWSVMEHSDPKDQYCFFFLYNGDPSETDRGVFRAMEETYANFSWKYLTVKSDLLANARALVPYISVATYYRLLIPELISGYDRCIYLDSDMLVLGDLAQLLDACDTAEGIPFEQCYIAAARDMYMQVKDLYWTQPLLDQAGIEDSRNYINAGMLVFNLSKLREDKMVDSFLPLLEKNYYFGEQDIFNITCAGKILYLPYRYNLGAYFIGNRYIAEQAGLEGEDWKDTMQGHPFICHFLGEEKPWNNIETVWENLWYETAKRLPQTEYVKEQLAILEEHKIDRWREDLLPAARRAGELILYGFSEAGFRLCNQLLAEGFTNIRCFCDKNTAKTGLSHRGIPCLERDALLSIPEDVMIIICPQKSWREISRELTEMGIDREKIVRFRSRDTRIINFD